MQHEQLLKQHQESMVKLEAEEYEMIKERLERIKALPSNNPSPPPRPSLTPSLDEEEQKVMSSEYLGTSLKYVDRILN